MAFGEDAYERRTKFIKLIRQIRLIRQDSPAQRVRSWRERTVSAQAQIDLMIRKVKDLLDSRGLYSDQHHQYIAYAEALAKSQDELGWMVDLIREHQILRDRFERRGLDSDTLDAIDGLVIYRTANK